MKKDGFWSGRIPGHAGVCRSLVQDPVEVEISGLVLPCENFQTIAI